MTSCRQNYAMHGAWAIDFQDPSSAACSVMDDLSRRGNPGHRPAEIRFDPLRERIGGLRLAALALAGDPRLEDFFTEEYALNHLIHRYPKPYIALMDGICMGGGMGISQGAALRVVTEHSKVAMPETHIGLFPDVGGGWFLSRCPGHLGEYLALTGHVLGADDAIGAGLADLRVAAARLPELTEALCGLREPTADGVLAAGEGVGQVASLDAPTGGRTTVAAELVSRGYTAPGRF